MLCSPQNLSTTQRTKDVLSFAHAESRVLVTLSNEFQIRFEDLHSIAVAK